MSKKIFDILKFNFILSLKLVCSYFKKKVLKVNLSDEERALIHHFNFIRDYQLTHISWRITDSIIQTKDIGRLSLRKFPTSDYSVFKQVFVDNDYGQLAKLIKDKLPHGKITMIDGGANVGFTSIAINNQLTQGYQLDVTLVEPFEENIKQIRRNLVWHNIYRFSIIKGGITNNSSFLTLDFDFRDSLEWSIQIKETTIPTDIKALEITDLMKMNKWQIIDILKLDIEGSEKELFSNKSYALNFLKHVKLLAIEIHHEYISEIEVLNILETAGFEMKRHGELFIGFNNRLI